MIDSVVLGYVNLDLTIIDIKFCLCTIYDGNYIRVDFILKHSVYRLCILRFYGVCMVDYEVSVVRDTLYLGLIPSHFTAIGRARSQNQAKMAKKRSVHGVHEVF